LALRRTGFWYTLTCLSSPQDRESSGGGVVDRENGVVCLGDRTVANLVMDIVDSNDESEVLSSRDIERVVGGDGDCVDCRDILAMRENSEG
jgi:hypothetical protein